MKKLVITAMALLIANNSVAQNQPVAISLAQEQQNMQNIQKIDVSKLSPVDKIKINRDIRDLLEIQDKLTQMDTLANNQLTPTTQTMNNIALATTATASAGTLIFIFSRNKVISLSGAAVGIAGALSSLVTVAAKDNLYFTKISKMSDDDLQSEYNYNKNKQHYALMDVKEILVKNSLVLPENLKN